MTPFELTVCAYPPSTPFEMSMAVMPDALSVSRGAIEGSDIWVLSLQAAAATVKTTNSPIPYQFDLGIGSARQKVFTRLTEDPDRFADSLASLGLHISSSSDTVDCRTAATERKT
jgi:hypothetical protein